MTLDLRPEHRKILEEINKGKGRSDATRSVSDPRRDQTPKPASSEDRGHTPDSISQPEAGQNLAPSVPSSDSLASVAYNEVAYLAASERVSGSNRSPDLLARPEGADLLASSTVEQELHGTASAAIMPRMLGKITEAIASEQQIFLNDNDTVEICITAKVQVRAVPRMKHAGAADVVEAPVSKEPVFLERFPEAFKKKTRKLLQGMFVLGCACKGGATSLGEAEEWLKKRHCPIPQVKSKLSEYLRSNSWQEAAPTLFIEFLKGGKEELSLREDGSEPVRDSKGRPLQTDSRRIIGFSEAGWRLWTAAGEFLRKHDRTFWTYAFLLPE